MKSFIEPSSVAIVGVPRRTGRGSFNILENMLKMGFRGRVYPVNPNAEEIMGIKAYPTVKEIPEPVDLAVLMIPRASVPGVLQECGQKQIRAVIVVSDGFAEADEEGKRLQEEVKRISLSYGIRVLGPNSLGVVNNFRRFSTTFLPVPPVTAPVALVSQSGGFFAGFSEFVAGKGIDLGNMCDIDFADALEYLEQDPEIRVIALHMEAVGDGRRFLEVARRVGRKKPVLVLKTGITGYGAEAAAGHTGSLTGSDAVFEAVCRAAGLIRVRNVDELGDFVKAFLHLPPFIGDRLAILTPTGGGAVMALDYMGELGFVPAQLSPKTTASLLPFWPPWSKPSNPVDMMSPGVMHGYKNVYKAALATLIQDPNVDAVLCIAGAPTLKTIKEVIKDQMKPVVTWALGRWEEVYSRMNEVNYFAVYPTPQRALKALAAVKEFTRGCRGSPG